MQTGTIAKVTDRGYGFIKTDDQEEDIFFHASELTEGDFNSLQEGDKVTFEVGENDKGPFAQNVTPAAE
ncbi:MAG: cold shock domain-containing protein [Candidatus Paceibacterota bacterium]